MDENGSQSAFFTGKNGDFSIPIFSLNYELPLYQRNIGGKKKKNTYKRKTRKNRKTRKHRKKRN